MDLSQDQSFLYIAKEALKAPIPYNWKKCQIDGQNAFINILTKEVLKEHPLDYLYRKHYLELKSLNLKRIVIDKENIDQNVQNHKINNEKFENVNEEFENVKTIRRKEFEERKKILELQRKKLEMRKELLMKKEGELLKEKEKALTFEKIELEKQFQQKVQDVHLRLMRDFNIKMEGFLIEFQGKFERKKYEVFVDKINEKRSSLMVFYNESLNQKINEDEDRYREFYEKYEENMKRKAEEMTWNEFQSEKFKVIQEKIKEINEERLSFDEDIKRKVRDCEEKMLQENTKIQKIEELKEIISEFSQEEQESKTREFILTKYHGILDELMKRIAEKKDEIKLAQIEMVSLENNFANESPEKVFKILLFLLFFFTKIDLKELKHENFDKSEEDITVLKQKHDSSNVSFADTTVFYTR